jgi:ribosomal protein S18 acetylase RimI-like enzyme
MASDDTSQIRLRTLVWPDDLEALSALDTDYSTASIFRVVQPGRGFILEEVAVDPPLRKAYPIRDEARELATYHWTRVATDGLGIVGLVALSYEHWNRRAEIVHLYVARRARKQGMGRRLVEAASEEAGRRSARCLWVETQTTNPGAIRFYERLGFTCCGLDTSLYDPNDVGPGEVAVFFERAIPQGPGPAHTVDAEL